MKISRPGGITTCVLAAAGLLGALNDAGAGSPGTTVPATVAELISRDIVDMPNKEVLMITVTYLPGGASLPHRHDAQVFVYVLEGAVTMQVDGKSPVTMGPGQTFYEGPEDVHRVSANASQSEPAKMLVFMVKDKGKPASHPLASKEAP